MSTSITEIPVKASTPYTVHISSGLLADCGPAIAALHSPCTAAIISDSNVAPLYLSTVEQSLKSAGFRTISFVFPAGEASKNIHTFSNILEFLAGHHITRTDLVVALGGGVTGDMAGFSAACILRGIPYVQIPTSLLADVDSSVGGKTAVDLDAGKNLAGAFKQPLAVFCDTDTLQTLPDEVFYDGCSECIKYGVLGSREILNIFECGDPRASIQQVIANSVQMKADYVAEDEFDTGLRRYLNLGHTLGHAIERRSNFQLMHGHAVAVGMVLISRAGEKMGITEPGTADRLSAILTRNHLPVSTSLSAEEITETALNDKKRKGDSIALIVPETLGKCVTKTIPVSELLQVVRFSLGEA